MQQKQAEQEEEFIVNKLMKRLDQLKREKQVLANEVWLSSFITSWLYALCLACYSDFMETSFVLNRLSKRRNTWSTICRDG